MSVNSSETQDDENLRRMAREWYGYGWWEAPFWFIGPEPGRPEKEDTPKKRCEAWAACGGGDLVDCKCHHFGFNWYDWHRDVPPPPTQPTWRQLIRLLLAARCGREPDIEDIRSHQQRSWGMRQSEEPGTSCVIELCSLASPTLKAKRNVAFDPHCFLTERIGVIRRKILDYKPKLVLMYGLNHTQHFQGIAGCALVPSDPLQICSTCFVHTPAPTSRGLQNSYWLQLAKKLRECCAVGSN
jgi:hypothetical protein